MHYLVDHFLTTKNWQRFEEEGGQIEFTAGEGPGQLLRGQNGGEQKVHLVGIFVSLEVHSQIIVFLEFSPYLDQFYEHDSGTIIQIIAWIGKQGGRLLMEERET
ncbi:hypothetical protein, partial [Candidatus Hakubella thermalkaliphila]